MPSAAGATLAAQLELQCSLSTYLQECEEADKATLAHKLHDELGGLLTAAKMDLSWVQSRIDPANPLISRLAQLGAVLDEAMDLKRHLVEQLRPSLLEHFGFVTAVRAHVESTCKKEGLRCEVTIDEEDAATPGKAASIALFRVVQAALENVIQHAAAKFVQLRVSSTSETLELALSDDGSGIAAGRLDAPESLGIAGMRHRVAALKGTIEFNQLSEDVGTLIKVKIPRSSL